MRENFRFVSAFPERANAQKHHQKPHILFYFYFILKHLILYFNSITLHLLNNQISKKIQTSFSAFQKKISKPDFIKFCAYGASEYFKINKNASRKPRSNRTSNHIHHFIYFFTFRFCLFNFVVFCQHYIAHL